LVSLSILHNINTMMLNAVSIPFHWWNSQLTRHSRSFHEFYHRYIGFSICARKNICMKLLTSSRWRGESNDTEKRISGIKFHHSLTFAQPHKPWKYHKITAYTVEQKWRLIQTTQRIAIFKIYWDKNPFICRIHKSANQKSNFKRKHLRHER